MAIENPYLDYFLTLPAGCWRDPTGPVDASELWSPEWLRYKSAVASAYAWAVPTQAAVETIARRTRRVIEIGAGSGYWAWLLSQLGVDVLAVDALPPSRTWHPVHAGTEAELGRHPDRTLFMCWPPWGSPMAAHALSAYHGDELVYVGEWRAGCAEPGFFDLLERAFEQVESVAIPRWFMRSDRLTVHRRR